MNEHTENQMTLEQVKQEINETCNRLSELKTQLAIFKDQAMEAAYHRDAEIRQARDSLSYSNFKVDWHHNPMQALNDYFSEKDRASYIAGVEIDNLTQKGKVIVDEYLALRGKLKTLNERKQELKESMQPENKGGEPSKKKRP